MTQGRPQNTENKLPVRNQPSVFFMCVALNSVLSEGEMKHPRSTCPDSLSSPGPQHPSPRLLLATVKKGSSVKQNPLDGPGHRGHRRKTVVRVWVKIRTEAALLPVMCP